ncbi:WD40 repeat-like protein [Laetiporus sulphureus 93-53]|uniref:WD40 repeat-like protein n=1 Tax=Laetiporus sulphureus 93-53 TaxID=1314785 RepID=A0A165CTD1_9APHY|nr:WD40 repeat-like protein [Laetiporus sulphureus 93-53]KZT03401.1 WD40 repeat-like protein [Laetiporus sulphureus 93-53]
MSSSSSTTTQYMCDTIPPARIVSESTSRTSSPPPQSAPSLMPFNASVIDNSSLQLVTKPDVTQAASSQPPSPEQSPARKLCVRHQRMADEGTNLKLQQALDALPVEEREAVNAVWSNFSSSSHPRRSLILQGLLTMCCFSQLSLLSEQLAQLIRLDPFAVLPREVALKILGYLDATSLCRAAQVNRPWKTLADDDILWRGICEQHIGQKCLKCGWGLPILEKRRLVRTSSTAPSPCSPPPLHDTTVAQPKRPYQPDATSIDSSTKRARRDVETLPPPYSPSPSASPSHQPDEAVKSISRLTPPPPQAHSPPTHMITRPWKDVYCERLRIERNWRRGRCTVRTLKGHTDGVMCLQFNETLSHPAFPVLITGSYDRTVRVWNLETGTEVHCLTGHTSAVRALQFDEFKLITGSLDHTMRVWNWRTGQCLRILEGHTEGVLCLNFDSCLLASGSVDNTIKVWNLITGECFTLRGHSDWVNSVQLWDASGSGTTSSSVFDCNPVESAPPSSSSSKVGNGKMLFSASDDGTIRLWDLSLRSCVRVFHGHVGQVQSLKLLVVDEGCEGGDSTPEPQEIAAPTLNMNTYWHPDHSHALPAPTESYSGSPNAANTALAHRRSSPAHSPNTYADATAVDQRPAVSRAGSPTKRQKPVLISGSLDNTIKLWDIETGKAVKTLFGHIEGVWAVASDKLRLVSGSHDRTIKVWVREEGRCMATLVGHRGAVTCLALGEDKIVSGSDDGDVRLWSFSG